jgi:hypothetical protein
MVIATIGGIAAFAVGLSKIAGVVDKLTSAAALNCPARRRSPALVASSPCGRRPRTSTARSTVVMSRSTRRPAPASRPMSRGRASTWSVGSTHRADGTSRSTATVRQGETFSVIELSFSALATGIGLIVGSIFGGFGLFFIGLVFVIIALFRRSSWTKRHGPGPMGPGGYQPPPGQQGWTAQPQAPAGWDPTGGGQAPAPGQGGSFPGQAPPPPGGQVPPLGGQAPPPPGGQPPPFGNAPTAPGGPPPPPPGPPPVPGGQGGAPPPPPPG